MLTFDLHLHMCHLYRPTSHAAHDAKATVLARFLRLEGRRWRRGGVHTESIWCRAGGPAS